MMWPSEAQHHALRNGQQKHFGLRHDASPGIILVPGVHRYEYHHGNLSDKTPWVGKEKKTRRLARNLIALLRNVGILLELHKLQETSSNQAQIKHESGRSLWQNMRQELRWTMVKMKICTCLPCQQISKHRCASGVRQNPVTIQPSSGLEPLNFPQFEGDP